MNIIKYFILLLLTFVIKVNSGVYNHLDIQLALLILSDHNGKIIKDTQNNYMKIKIREYSKNNQINYEEADITDILSVLVEIKDKYKSQTPSQLTQSKMKKELENKFKELYIKAERLATYRMEFQYQEMHNINQDSNYFEQYTSNLFNEFKFNTDDMRNKFDGHVNDVYIIRYFTTNQKNGNIELVNI